MIRKEEPFRRKVDLLLVDEKFPLIKALFPQKGGGTFPDYQKAGRLLVGSSVEAGGMGGGVFDDPFFNSFISDITWGRGYIQNSSNH